MKKYFLVFIAVVSVLSFAVDAHAWEVSFDNYAAGSIYEEYGSEGSTNINSDWSSFCYKGNLVLSKYDNKNIQGELFYGMSFSPDSTETWYLNGTEYQTNDMGLWGIDTGVAAGWAIPIEIPEKWILPYRRS